MMGYNPRQKIAIIKGLLFCSILIGFSCIGDGIAQEEKLFDAPAPLSVNGERSRTIEIRAKKFSYTPNKIKVNKGDIVKIRLISEDVQHGFFLDGYGIETSAYPGKEGVLKFSADKTGRYSFRCSVTCGEFHPFMIGYLTVEPNFRFIIFVSLAVLAALVSFSLMYFKRKKADGNV